MSDSNLQLWDRQKATDPAFTKSTSNGRFSFTAIDPQYQMYKGTAEWGPYGDRWGIRDLVYTFMTGESGEAVLLTGTFFYPNGDKECSFGIASSIKFNPNDEFAKKLLTQARSKALSFLGFSADVFMGQFDDVSYVNEQKLRFGEQSAFVQQAISKIMASKTQAELDECEKRAHTLVGKKTVTNEVFQQLMSAVADRREEIG